MLKICRYVFAGFFLAALLMVTSANAFADNIVITVDENGHGTLLNPVNGTFNLPSSMAADAGPGGQASALTYNLLGPPGLVIGDVILTEGGGTGDVLRFNPNGTLVFYSVIGEGSLADTGFPTAFYTNNVTFAEGVDGSFTYTPTSTQPGFVAGAAFGVTYRFISDASTPEPTTMVLLGTGLVGAAAKIRKRRKAADRKDN